MHPSCRIESCVLYKHCGGSDAYVLGGNTYQKRRQAYGSLHAPARRKGNGYESHMSLTKALYETTNSDYIIFRVLQSMLIEGSVNVNRHLPTPFQSIGGLTCNTEQQQFPPV